MSYGYWCWWLFSQILHLKPVWLEWFSWINRSIVGKVRLLVFLYLIAHMFEYLDHTCLISLFACSSCLFFIYIYIQISWGFVQDCVFSFQVARIGRAVDLVWLHCTSNIFVKALPLCIPLTSFHCRSTQQWAFPLLFLLSFKINLPVTCLFLLWSDLFLRIEYIF